MLAQDSVMNWKLRMTRTNSGYNMKKVADAIGVSVSSYCRKEKGEQYFIQHEIEDLIALFGKPYEEIFGSLKSV